MDQISEYFPIAVTWLNEYAVQSRINHKITKSRDDSSLQWSFPSFLFLMGSSYFWRLNSYEFQFHGRVLSSA